MLKKSWWRGIAFALIVLAGARGELQAQTATQRTGSCDIQALEASKNEFLRMVQLRRDGPGAVSEQDLREASTAYVINANACYQAFYGTSTEQIDEGGLVFSPSGSQAYNLGGTKWGAGSPYTGGVNATGPRIAGGTVTYSFMASGIDMAAEGADPSLAVSSLPTFAPCFVTEITNAFTAWSAVANIQFTQVADNGAAFNAVGAVGDVRIGAHTFDGPSSVLAHAFFPPPNGSSASGDLHFDRAENWSCTAGPGLIDIGIVAIHEIGHSIGLGHETTNPAIMQPFYNPALTVPLADDINGATNIYGAPPARKTPYDFDGDGKTDISVWRPSNGVWFEIRSSDGTIDAQQWGSGFNPYNDVPVSADYDGDGKADVAVWRSSTGVWYVIRSSDGGVTTRQWGAGISPYNDVPVPADYDGDGKADFAVWRSSTGVWYIVRSSDGGVTSRQWGAGFSPYNDVPVPGDYDGDGRADIAVWRASTGVWFIIRSSDGGVSTQQWGAGISPYDDVPVPGDYDGDGKTDIAVWRSMNGVWYVRRSSDATIVARQWGISPDIPIPRAKIQ